MPRPLLFIALSTLLAGPASAQTVKEGAGLVRIDPRPFTLSGNEWARRAAIVRRLARRLPSHSIAQVAADANRKGKRRRRAPGVKNTHVAFEWNEGDGKVKHWYPQGISGSADSTALARVGGKKLLLVSWYHKPENDKQGSPNKGVRISVVDVTSMNRVRYRHVLLVDPVLENGRADFAPVKVHAGGIAWYGRYLYVVDTSVGFRVFDFGRLFRVRTGDRKKVGRHGARYHAFDYKYVACQVNTYRLTSGSAKARFSFVSLDRSTYPHTLLTGEYKKDSIRGRLHRWSLNPRTKRLDSTLWGIKPTEAFIAGHDRMQGAQSWAGSIWLSCSSQKKRGPFWARKNYGQLYRARPGKKSKTFEWVYGPEDLHYAPSSGNLWSLSEFPKHRVVFAVRLSDVRR